MWNICLISWIKFNTWHVMGEKSEDLHDICFRGDVPSLDAPSPSYCLCTFSKQTFRADRCHFCFQPHERCCHICWLCQQIAEMFDFKHNKLEKLGSPSMNRNMLRTSIFQTRVKTCAQPSAVLQNGEKRK